MLDFIRSEYKRVMPSEIAQLVIDNVNNPPEPARDGGLLEMGRLDHIAIALRNWNEWAWVTAYMQQNGADTLDGPYLWTDDLEDLPSVPSMLKKYMSVLKVGPDIIVLLAPATPGDLIAKTVKSAGENTIHHMAYHVGKFTMVTEALLNTGRVERISDYALDENKLDQVFLSVKSDSRILELVHRYPGFTGTFTHKNIETLTEGEAHHDRNADGES